MQHIKSTKPTETTHTIELTEAELDTIVVLLGATSGNPGNGVNSYRLYSQLLALLTYERDQSARHRTMLQNMLPDLRR